MTAPTDTLDCPDHGVGYEGIHGIGCAHIGSPREASDG